MADMEKRIINNKKEKKEKTSKKKSKKNQNLSAVGVDNKNMTMLSKNSNFAVVEAYKTLRTNVIFSARGAGCKKFVVTSPFPGEGKTTNAINLAISFAQTDKRVLLIDADMRKPKLAKYFNVDSKVGLSNLLSGIFDDENTNCICKTEYDNLDLMPAGHIPPNPIELLSSENMHDVLAKLEDMYDYVIIDTPPINIVSDAMVLHKEVTGYLLVARCDYTEYKAMDMAISKFDIAGIKPLGVILNVVGEHEKKYSYRSKYRYKSHYAYYR